VAVVGIVIGATAVANAAQPSLPSQSVAQLLADVQRAAIVPQGPVTATIQETANLGLPALPQIGGITGQGGQLGALNALSGTTTVSIWYLNQSHLRIAQPVQMGESDLRVDGNQVWLWDSKTQTATHVVLPRDFGNGQRSAARLPGGQGNPIGLKESPQQAARQALAAVGPSTSVTLGPNVTVAGRSAYQISVAPKSSGSLVGQILIAIDAARHIPLRVEVIARGSSSPAYEVGYTALSFGPPAMSNFSFTPPPGAQVKTETVPATAPAGLKGGLGLHGLGLGALGLGALGLGALGSGPAAAPFGTLTPQRAIHVSASCPPATSTTSTTCAVLKASAVQRPPIPKAALKQIEAQFAKSLPKSMTKAQRAAAIKTFEQQLTTGMKASPGNGGGFFNVRRPGLRAVKVKLAKGRAAGIIRAAGTPLPAAGTGSPKVLGKDWTSVLATPASPAVAAAVNQLLATPKGQHSSFGVFGSSSQEAPAPGSGLASAPPVPIGPDLAVLRTLLAATTPVHGSWGSGRLLRSALLTVLVTSKGQVLAGAVTPSVLYADAASLSK
jgi:outer membrane lipoprotein-sorting protein